MTRAREAKGLKRVQLAELVGCTSALIGQIEAGKTHPSPARFRELAAALGMPEDELREQ
jgi:transcriptional regulator with XRE-family HTH domain